MNTKTSHDWDSLDAQAILKVEGGEAQTITDLARLLNVPRGTLSTRFSEMGINEQNLKDIGSIIEKWNREHDVSPVEKIYEDKQENNWGILATDRRVKTLADLIRVCKIDTKVWEVERWVANKWEVVIANRSKRDGSGKAHPLFQVKAWLRRIQPIAISPVIKPIQVTAKLPKPTKSNNEIKRAMQVPDLQGGFRKDIYTNKLVPFHDRRVLDIVLQLLGYQHFDDVTFLGDELDLSEWTTHWQIEPEFYHTTQATLIEMHWWLAQVRQLAPNAQIDMLSGNHDRFKDALIAHLRSAYQLRPADELHRDAILTMPRMLALDKLHIGYIDGYKNGSSKKWLNDKICLTHGDIARSTPGSTAAATSERHYMTTVFAHKHSRELASKTVTLRDERFVTTAFCPGCACHVDGRVPGSKEDSQWQQGIGIVEYTDAGAYHIIPVEINDGVAIYDGREFVARNRDADADKVIEDGLRQSSKD